MMDRKSYEFALNLGGINNKLGDIIRNMHQSIFIRSTLWNLSRKTLSEISDHFLETYKGIHLIEIAI